MRPLPLRSPRLASVPRQSSQVNQSRVSCIESTHIHSLLQFGFDTGQPLLISPCGCASSSGPKASPGICRCLSFSYRPPSPCSSAIAAGPPPTGAHNTILPRSRCLPNCANAWRRLVSSTVPPSGNSPRPPDWQLWARRAGSSQEQYGGSGKTDDDKQTHLYIYFSKSFIVFAHHFLTVHSPHTQQHLASASPPLLRG